MARTRRAGLLALALAMIGVVPLGATPPAAAIAPVVGVASSVEQIRPDDEPVARPGSASLVAARNETESFQLVVQGPAQDVSVAGDLFGWGTTSLHRVGYYTATERSDREGATGRWGDPLIPSRDLMYGETRNAFPFDVPAGENRVVWVDVFVPPGTPAGTYSSQLTVSATGGPATVPVEVEVLGLDLPSTSTLPSAFWTAFDGAGDEICRGHTGQNNCGGDADLRRSLYSMYSRMALENRVTIANGSGLRHDQSPANYGTPAAWENVYEGPIIRGTATYPAGASYRLTGARSTIVGAYAYSEFHCLQACAEGWSAEANEAGQTFADRFRWYGCDEPGSDAEDWQSCATHLDQARDGLEARSLATATIAQYTAAGAAHIPDLSVLVPILNSLHPKGGADQRPSYDAFDAQAGRDVWLYTSCMSHGCGVGDTPEAAYDGWPGYGIDAPAAQHRAVSWMAWRYRAAGELYWAFNQRLASAWDVGGLWWDGANGDGTLFYPGTPARIGGVHHIPLESIRLKRIRDGREDYEYMHWLREQGHGAEVDAIVQGLLPTASSATEALDGTGPGTLLEARNELVDLVRSAIGPSDDPGSIAFSSDRDGDLEIHVTDPTGTRVRQLTFNSVADQFPAWSPDGARIAWTRQDDVWVMDADGSGATNLTADLALRAGKPAWSPDGSLLAFVVREAGAGPPLSDIWTMAPDGSAKTEVVTYSTGQTYAFDPVWAGPTTIVFSFSGGATGLHRIETNGTGFAGLTSAEDEVADAALVSDRLTFSRAGGDAGYDVFVSSADGTGAVNLTDGTPGAAGTHRFQSTWAPDEERLAFVATAGGDPEIWRIADTGSPAVRLTANGARDVDPDWGPAPFAPGPPSAPARPTTRVGDQRDVAVSFAAVTTDGGDPITSYIARCDSDNGGTARSAAGTASPIRVERLTAGRIYECRVRARNALGAGPWSPPSGSFIPRTLPGAPTAVEATPGRGWGSVSFRPPASDGGSSILRFTARCTSPTGPTGVASRSDSAILVGGLQSGARYRCRVRAVNSAGPGPWSEPSAWFTPR